MTEKFTSIARSRGTPVSSTKTKKPSSSVVIVILVIVAIIGFVFIARAGKGKNESEEQTSEVQGTTEEVDFEEPDPAESLGQEEITEVDVSEKTQDGDAEDIPESFSKEDQHVGSEDVAGAIVSTVEHEGYEGFLRIVFTIESEEGIPYTTASLQEGSNLILLKFYGIAEDNSGIRTGSSADVTGSVVSTIFHKVTSDEDVSYYSIGVKTPTGFSLHTLEEPARIVLDIEEQVVEEGDGDEFAFSKEAQSIEGNASGDVVYVEGISHSDQGGYFRVIFRLGTIGTGNIPQATAELVDYEGGRAIKVEISSLYDDYIGKNGYDDDYEHVVVSGMSGTYSDHSSTYYIDLKAEREFKLHYMTAPAQLIVDVKR